MKCPKCKNRLIKSTGDTSQVYVRRIIMNKSDHSFLVMCDCKALVKPDKELTKALRSALLLVKE